MDYLEFPNNKTSRLQRQKRRDKRLAEELIECRRYAGGDSNKKVRQKGDKKRHQKMDYNDLHPSHEPINLKNTTGFEDNLEPLERFLRSNVGRPWSEVYAELNCQLDRSTVSGQHVFDHLLGYMEEHRWGRPAQFEGNHYRTQNDGTSNRFAVHPDTGLLCIFNPRNLFPNGPFPKVARFKKAKESRKAKLRLGLHQKSRPIKQLPNVKEWFQQLIVQQIGGSTGYKWDELLHKNAGFREGEFHIILNVNRMEWSTYQKQLWGTKYQPIPCTKLKGRIWLKQNSVQKSKLILFECFWHETFNQMLDWTEV